MATSTCRLCGARLDAVFADLGMQPLANRLLTEDQLNEMEPFYPLRAMVCSECLLVQLGEFEPPEVIFTDYVYLSSASSTWVEHAERYTDLVVDRLGLSSDSKVVELASNDGYLLQHFVRRGIPVLGIEPAANVAEIARDRGIQTIAEFFGTDLADKLAGESAADLLVGNNVLAHVPDLHDFVEGMRRVLKPTGTITMEFPHLLRLTEGLQYDTIYHEHFSYFSLLTVERAFGEHGLVVTDVEQLPTHGGSLRIWARHEGAGAEPGERVVALRATEAQAGLHDLAAYSVFDDRVRADKRSLLARLGSYKERGCSIVGYGAPAKGNTLLNYCGIGTDYLDFTVDISPSKQGRFLPGTHIPIHPLDAVRDAHPDLVFVLPWNIEREITESMAWVRDWGGRFLVRRPELTEIE